MILSIAISISTLFFTVVLGVFILIQNWRNNENRAFLGVSMSIAFWMATNILSDISINTAGALFWAKAASIGPLFFAVSFFYLIVEIFDRKDWVKYKKLFWVLVSLALLLTAFTPTSLNVKGVTLTGMGTEFSPGVLYYFLLSYELVVSGLSFYILTKVYLRKIEPQSNQARLLILGTGLSLGLALVTNVFLPLYGISIASIFGPPVILFFIFLTAIAVLKYHLVDSKVIAAESFTFSLWVVLLIKIFLSNNFQDLLANAIVFVGVLFFGALLIRSVIKEVEQREKIEKIEKELEKAYAVEKKANEELKALDNIKNQFLMTIQHHLRTPLTSMRGYADLLLGGTFGKMPKKIKDVVEKFEVSTTSLIKMVNDFLDITQFQLGKSVVSLKEGVDLIPILQEVVGDIKLEAEKKGIYLKFDLDPQQAGKPESACLIKADESKLKAAVVNIFDNSVKYTEKGGVTMTLNPKSETLNPKPCVLITIKDTGMGIAKERLPKLFNSTFERTEEAKKTFTSGRGIGLYLSDQIVKAHGGKVWAESEGEGKGSTFYIELPR